MTLDTHLIGQCRLLSLPVINDARGKLSFLQNSEELGFEIQRVFWCHNVPAGDQRGGHAYQKQHEAILAVSGSFDVELRTSDEKQTVTLNRPHMALVIPPMVWRTMSNFSSNALSAHLSSSQFDAHDYVRDWHEFQSHV